MYSDRIPASSKLGWSANPLPLAESTSCVSLTLKTTCSPPFAWTPYKVTGLTNMIKSDSKSHTPMNRETKNTTNEPHYHWILNHFVYLTFLTFLTLFLELHWLYWTYWLSFIKRYKTDPSMIFKSKIKRRVEKIQKNIKMNQCQFFLAKMTLATTSLKQCSVFISLRVMELIFS